MKCIDKSTYRTNGWSTEIHEIILIHYGLREGEFLKRILILKLYKRPLNTPKVRNQKYTIVFERTSLSSLGAIRPTPTKAEA